MNRPDARNALNSNLIEALYAALGDADAEPLGFGARQDEIAECNRRQVRPQDAEFLELIVSAPLHQQRNEIAYPAALEPCISVLYYGTDVIMRKSRVFLGEATLNVANQHPLFLRHPDIVTAILTVVKTLGVNGLLCKSLEKNTFATTAPGV